MPVKSESEARQEEEGRTFKAQCCSNPCARGEGRKEDWVTRASDSTAALRHFGATSGMGPKQPVPIRGVTQAEAMAALLRTPALLSHWLDGIPALQDLVCLSNKHKPKWLKQSEQEGERS